MGQELTQIRLK